jgi:hypothetical protein
VLAEAGQPVPAFLADLARSARGASGRAGGARGRGAGGGRRSGPRLDYGERAAPRDGYGGRARSNGRRYGGQAAPTHTRHFA